MIEIQYSNWLHKESRYNSSVDNQACLIDPYNLLVCPIVDYTASTVIPSNVGGSVY